MLGGQGRSCWGSGLRFCFRCRFRLRAQGPVSGPPLFWAVRDFFPGIVSEDFERTPRNFKPTWCRKGFQARQKMSWQGRVSFKDP